MSNTRLSEENHAQMLTNWLLVQGVQYSGTNELLHHFALQLNGIGLAITRINLLIKPLHPEVAVVNRIWRRTVLGSEVSSQARVVHRHTFEFEGGTVQEISFAYGSFGLGAYKTSPLYLITHGSRLVHRAISRRDTSFEFPVFKDLHAEGATGYVGFPLQFLHETENACTFVTDKAGGFTEANVQLLMMVARALAPILEIHASRLITETLLTTYLGKEAGERVLAGKIRRGDVERIDAAIWFSDLRGFTELSSQLSSEDLIGWLNEYFGAISVPIAEAGGEILKFIGDAVLAVFPVRSNLDHRTVCRQALRAAQGAEAALAELNAARVARGCIALRHGIGLHIGEAQYGNIGGDQRLDFTVIGQAVNMASRIESLCGKLGKSLLVSSEFAAHVGDSVTSVGRYPLKGIASDQELFACAPEG